VQFFQVQIAFGDMIQRLKKSSGEAEKTRTDKKIFIEQSPRPKTERIQSTDSDINLGDIFQVNNLIEYLA